MGGAAAMTGIGTIDVAVAGAGAETGAIIAVPLVCFGVIIVVVVVEASAGVALGAVAGIMVGARVGFIAGARFVVLVGVGTLAAVTVTGEAAGRIVGVLRVVTAVVLCIAPPALGARNGEPEFVVEGTGAAVAAATTAVDHGRVELAALPFRIRARVDGWPASFLASCLLASRILGDTVLAELGVTSVCFVLSASFE
jgi:hypothetical protein